MRILRWVNVMLPAGGAVAGAAVGRYDAALWAEFGAVMALNVALNNEQMRAKS